MSSLVSVIIPSYNHAPYIEACINSVLAQSHSHYEILVVDDGSTDGSLDILRQFGDRIALYVQSNRGTQAARNQAISRSSGDYIALLDSDDLWLPDKLDKQLRVFEQDPSLGLVYGQVCRIDQRGQTLGAGRPMGRAPGSPVTEDLLLGCFLPTCTVVFRRACIAKLPNPFDESYVGAADWLLWLRMSQNCSFGYVAEPLALYREHPANTSRAMYKRDLGVREDMRVIEEVIQHMPLSATRLVSLRARAIAHAHLRTMLWSCQMGQFEQALQDLRRAVEADLTLCQDAVTLGHWLVGGARYIEGNVRSKKDWLYQNGQVLESAGVTSAQKRRVLAAAAIELGFDSQQEGDRASVQAMMSLGLLLDPGWARNRGVVSLLLRSALARFVAEVL